jgi:hypothetical protein
MDHGTGKASSVTFSVPYDVNLSWLKLGQEMIRLSCPVSLKAGHVYDLKMSDDRATISEGDRVILECGVNPEGVNQ